MVNDLDYIKLSFSELPHFTTSDSWINYKFNEADTSWMIFALEERVGQEPKWRCIHSSYWGSNHCMYGIYKKGAAWEAHIGQRLVRGKKVAARIDDRRLGGSRGREGGLSHNGCQPGFQPGFGKSRVQPGDGRQCPV